MHAQAVLICLWWGIMVGGGGWCWGDDAQRRALPPGGWLSASLSPAWSFIIYRRDKIKQTQQNGVKSESCGSHIYTLIEREGWRCTRRQSLSNFLLLPPSIPQQAAVRWKPSIRETTMLRTVCVRRTGCNINGVICQVIKAKFTLNVLCLFLHLEVPWLVYSY